MKAFLCGHCGATLDIPDDPKAVDARCPFCRASTPLPDAVLALRAPPKQLPVTSSATLPNGRAAVASAAAVTVLLAGVGAAVALLRTPSRDPVVVSSEPVPPSPPTETRPSERTSVPAPNKVEDRRTTGEEQTSQRMKELHASGCKDVILPPSQTSGEQTLDTKFVMNGRCVTVLAISGVPENELTLTMTTPLGDPVATPPKSASVDFSICPKMAGRHPTKIVPRTNDTYTVAAIECPAPAKKKTP